MLIALRKIQFWKKMYYHDSIVSHIFANECYHSVLAVAARYNISAYHVMHSNVLCFKIRILVTLHNPCEGRLMCITIISQMWVCVVYLLFTVL